MLYFKNIIIVSLFLKDITKGADLTLVFMDELNKETMAMSYYYKMADKKTTILIKREALFATENIAHEIGHVLGAGHGPDISKLKLRVLECNVRLTLIPYSDMNSLFCSGSTLNCTLTGTKRYIIVGMKCL